jgi:hypothetical protein
LPGVLAKKDRMRAPSAQHRVDPTNPKTNELLSRTGPWSARAAKQAASSNLKIA